jgi:hypothetical protein
MSNRSPTFDTGIQPPVQKFLPRGSQTRLLVPQGYQNHFETTNRRPINQTDWMCTTIEDIKVYMMSSEFMYFNNSVMMSTTKVPISLTSVPKLKTTPDDFITGIKYNHPNCLDGSSTAPPVLSSGAFNPSLKCDQA